MFPSGIMNDINADIRDWFANRDKTTVIRIYLNNNILYLKVKSITFAGTCCVRKERLSAPATDLMRKDFPYLLHLLKKRIQRCNY